MVNYFSGFSFQSLLDKLKAEPHCQGSYSPSEWQGNNTEDRKTLQLAHPFCFCFYLGRQDCCSLPRQHDVEQNKSIIARQQFELQRENPGFLHKLKLGERELEAFSRNTTFKHIWNTLKSRYMKWLPPLCNKVLTPTASPHRR